MPIRKIRNPKNFDKCRWCNHYFLSHTSMADGTNFCEWGNSSFYPTKCYCTDFAPKDNLEFLEYKSDKKGKENGTRNV
jgi:hypothetical protein